ncbi:hypothetical protein GCM10028773_31760 [Spirosoma koreense]
MNERVRNSPSPWYNEQTTTVKFTDPSVVFKIRNEVYKSVLGQKDKFLIDCITILPGFHFVPVHANSMS